MEEEGEDGGGGEVEVDVNPEVEIEPLPGSPCGKCSPAAAATAGSVPLAEEV